jgi:hypothetical protein
MDVLLDLGEHLSLSAMEVGEIAERVARSVENELKR